MTNNQLTDQKLTKIVESAEAVISALAGNNDDIHPDDSTKMFRLWDALNDDDATPEVVLVMAKELQERRKADREPVGYFGRFDPDDEDLIDQCSKNVKGAFPLYRHAQPAPVVPEEMPCGGAADDYHDGYQDGWNACRAAMLQAEPVTTANKLGNSPVIPEGSASMLRRWLAFGRGMQNAGSQLPHNLIAETEEMFAAAPHDTHAMSSMQSVVTVSDTWIPVSERLPERGDYLVTDGCDFDVQLFNGEEFIPGFVWEDKITHWMPLPAVPPAPTQENI